MWIWIVNIVLFKAGWIVCALACASKSALIAIAAAGVVAGVHLAWSPNRTAVAAVLAFAALLGIITDTLLIALHAIQFPNDGWMPPIAFICFWINYATLQTIAMRPLVGRWWLVGLLGLIGGPAAYMAGARLGALSLPSGNWPGLIPVAILWAVVAPLLLWMASRWTTPPPTAVAADTLTTPRPPAEEMHTHAG